ncbi:MAG: iron-containing redox enzyme family protein [Actinomycetota bacterium]|nr:iron-containing redox enzyme family protein [Actinomycetota bacterium]
MPPKVRLDDEDLNLALYCCYELHYRGFAAVDEAWEWHPGLLAFRASLEDVFLTRLIDEVGPPHAVGDAETELTELMARGNGPSLSRYMAGQGSVEEFRQFAVHRSAYQLKEADPHTWAIPRLTGEPKAALVEIQSDEYGSGRCAQMHSSLFAETMACLDLNPAYGAYLPAIPGVTLATVNLVSYLGLHRRWRGALLGHLAVFEMASVVPNTRYGDALRRLGFGTDATAFYDVHVQADAIHEVIALHRLVGAFAAAEPGRAGDVLFGARALMAVEERFTRHLLGAWSQGRSSLLFVPPGWPADPAAHRDPAAAA